MLGAELARTLGIRPAQLAGWTQRGMIRAGPRRGRGYEYSALDVLRARFIVKRRGEHVGLTRIAAELKTLDEDALRALFGEPPTEKAAARAAAISGAPIGAGARVVELMPGLTLVVRDDASPLAQRIARDIVAAAWPR
jgi:DNA-binding transcriptional MerR regulator